MFVTTNLAKREQVFADPAAARIAVETLYSIQDYYPYFLYAFVIMPEHCHILLSVPEGGSVSKVMGIYKRAVCFNIGRGPLWQSRFHLDLPKDPYPVMEYIHQNPVKRGLCSEPKDYPWSSASGRWDLADIGWYL